MTDLGLVAVLITTCASAVVAIISQIQHSRCERIYICWGLFECARKVPGDDVIDPEEINTEEINEQLHDINNQTHQLLDQSNTRLHNPLPPLPPISPPPTSPLHQLSVMPLKPNLSQNT